MSERREADQKFEVHNSDKQQQFQILWVFQSWYCYSKAFRTNSR